MAKKMLFVVLLGILTLGTMSAFAEKRPPAYTGTVTSQIGLNGSQLPAYQLYGDGKQQYTDRLNGNSFSQYFDGTNGKSPDGTVKSIIAENGEWVLDLTDPTSKRSVGVNPIPKFFDIQPTSTKPYMSSRCTELNMNYIDHNLRTLQDGSSISCGTYLQLVPRMRVPTTWTRLFTKDGYTVIEGVSTAAACTVEYWDKVNHQCGADPQPYQFNFRIRLIAPVCPTCAFTK